MVRTKTSHLPSFTRPAPNYATFSFPSHPSNPKDQSPSLPSTTITIPPRSNYTTSLHWHVTHTEYIKVISGAALITVSNKAKIYTADDGIATIPRYARHEWMRFDRPVHLLSRSQREAQEKWIEEQGDDVIEKLRGMDLVAEEWTDPADGEKEIFFRNIFSVVGEVRWKEGWWGGWMMWLQVMLVMWELDNFVMLVDLGGEGDGRAWRGVGETGWTYGVMGAAAVIGRVVGLRAVREEYTPGYLLGAWEGGKERKGA